MFIEHYLSILGVIYKNWGFYLEGCLTCEELVGSYSQEMMWVTLQWLLIS